MPRLDLQTRSRVVRLKEEGHTYKAIQKCLEEEGIIITIKRLYLLMAKYYKTNSVVDRPRSSSRKILSHEHYTFIDDLLTENDQLTSRKLGDLLRDNVTAYS